MTKATNSSNGAALGIDQVFSKREARVEKVPVPEWGGHVLVRGMNGRERDAWEESLIDQSSRNPKDRKVTLKNQRARIVAMCVVNEDGARVFSEADIHRLGELEAAPLDRIYDVATALSGIGDDDLEELLGKFKEASSTASPSD